MFSTLIEFVGGGGGDIPVNPGAQTSDMMLMACVFFLALFVIGVMFLSIRKKATAGTSGSEIAEKSQAGKKLLVVAVSILAITLAAFSFIGGAFALSQNQSAAQSLNKVQAVVDESTGQVTIGDAILTNETEDTIQMQSLVLNLMEGIDDGDCTWTIALDGQVVYQAQAGVTTEISPITIVPDQSVRVSFATDMEPIYALLLIGEEVAQVDYGTSVIGKHQATVNLNTDEVSEEAATQIENAGWVFNDVTNEYVKFEDEETTVQSELDFFEDLIDSRLIVKVDHVFQDWAINPPREKFDTDINIDANWKYIPPVVTNKATINLNTNEISDEAVRQMTNEGWVFDPVNKVYVKDEDPATTVQSELDFFEGLIDSRLIVKVDHVFQDWTVTPQREKFDTDINITANWKEVPPVVEHQATVKLNTTEITDEAKQQIADADWISVSTLEEYIKLESPETTVQSELNFFKALIDDKKITKTGNVFKDWTVTPSIDKFTEDVTITANWEPDVPPVVPTLEGDVYNEDKTPAENILVTVYDKNTGEVLATIYTDENGHYEFTEEQVPKGADVIITYESDADTEVIPSQEVIVGQDQPKDSYIDDNGKSGISGTVDGLPEKDPESGQPQVWAKFTDEETGKEYIVPVVPNSADPSTGTYDIPVPSDKKGDITFFVSPDTEDQYDTSVIEDAKTPASGGDLDDQDGLIIDKNDKEHTGEFIYTITPATPPTEVEITLTDEDGNEYKYIKETDEGGKIDFNVPEGYDYDVKFEDPQGNEYHEFIPADEVPIGESTETPINLNDKREVRVNLDGGSVSATPEGWTPVATGVYGKEYIVGSNVEAIVDFWNTIEITAPAKSEFDYWDPAEGPITKATEPFTIKAIWHQVITATLEGDIIDESGDPAPRVTVTVYNKNTGEELGTTNTDDNGHYEFYEEDVPEGVEVIITFESQTPSEVAPSQELRVGDKNPEDATLNGNGKSTIKGSVNGLPAKDTSGQPQVWAQFTDEDGNKYIAPVISNPSDPSTGTYELDVPAESNGDITFFVSPDQGDKYTISIVEDVETPAAGGDLENQDGLIVTKGDPNTTEVIYKIKPVPNPPIEVEYKVKDGDKEYKFKKETDPNTGEVKFNVPTDKEGEIYFIDNDGKEYNETIPVGTLTPGEPYVKIIHADQFRTYMVDLNGGVLDDTDIPEGWVKKEVEQQVETEDGIENKVIAYYSKSFILGTNILDVIAEWGTSEEGDNPVKFTKNGHHFKSWDYPQELTNEAVGDVVFPIWAQYYRDDHFLAEPEPYHPGGIFQIAFDKLGFDVTLATAVEFKKVDDIDAEIAANARPNPYKPEEKLSANVSASGEGPVVAYITTDPYSNSYMLVVVTDNVPNKSIWASDHSFKRMFANFTNISYIDFGEEGVFDNTWAIDYSSMFEDFGKKASGKMPTISFSGKDGEAEPFVVSEGADLTKMFFNCNASVDLSNLDITQAGCLDRMFSEYCRDLNPKFADQVELKFADKDSHSYKFPAQASIYGIFNECNYDLIAGNDVLSQLDFSNRTDLKGLFYNYKGAFRINPIEPIKSKKFNLASLTIPESITDMTEMFAYSFDNNSEVYLILPEGFVLASNCTGMFKGCDYKDLNLEKVDFRKLENASYMFDSYGNLDLLKTTGGSNVIFPEDINVSTKLDCSYMYHMALIKCDLFDHIPGAKIKSVKGMFEDYGNGTGSLVKEEDIEALEIVFPDNYQIGSSSLEQMFRFSKCNVDLTNLNTSNVSCFDNMFEGFGYITPDCDEEVFTVTFPESFATANTDVSMKAMFDTAQIFEIDLTSFDFSKVKDFSYMFRNYGLNYSLSFEYGIDTVFGSFYPHITFPEKVETAANADMSHMFEGYRNVDSDNLLDISGFDTSKVVNFEGMFKGFNSYWNQQLHVPYTRDDIDTLKSNINIQFPAEFSTAEGANMSYMFEQAQVINTAALPGVTKDDSRGSVGLDLSMFKTLNVVNMSHMFDNCFGKLPFSGKGGIIITEIDGFLKCTIDVSGWDISKVKDMSYMFYGATPADFYHDYTNVGEGNSEDNREYGNLYPGLAGKITLFGEESTPAVDCDCSYMFSQTGFADIDLGQFDTKNVTNFSYMFANYAKAEYPGKIELEDMNLENAANVEGMFYNAYFNYTPGGTDYVKIDLTSMGGDEGPVSTIKDLSYMFYGLKCDELDISNWNPKSCTNMEGMFMQFGYDPWSFDVLDERYSKIDFPTAKGSWTTGPNCNMKMMFSMCLADVDLSGFDVSNVYNMHGMFLGYGSTIDQVLSLILPKDSDMKLKDKDFASSVLASVLAGDTQGTDNFIDQLTNPAIQNVDNAVTSNTALLDSLTSQYNDATNAVYGAAESSAIDYQYGDQNFEKVGFSKDDLANVFMQADLSNISSDYVNEQLLGYADNAYSNYMSDIKQALAECVANSDMPNLLANINLDELNSEKANSATPNFACPYYTITFPTDKDSWNAGANCSYCSMRTMFALCNVMNIGWEGEPIDDYMPDFSGFNTSNVIDMGFMFTGFMFGIELGFKKVNTNEDPEYNVFDISSFDTSKVKDMTLMFALFGDVDYDSGSYLTKIKFGENFKINEKCKVAFMFLWCRAAELDLSSINLADIGDVSFMFTLCCAEKLIIRGTKEPEPTNTLTNMNYLFALYGVPAYFIDQNRQFQPSKQQQILFIGDEGEGNEFVIPQNCSIKGMFAMSNLYVLNLPYVDVSARTSLSRMFEFAMAPMLMGMLDFMPAPNKKVKMPLLDISTWDISNVTDFTYMFALSMFCPVKMPDMSVLNEETGVDLSHMFFFSLVEEQYVDTAGKVTGCGLDLTNWALANATNLRGMFMGYGAFAADYALLDPSYFLQFGKQEISKCTDMSHMFELCGISLDLSQVSVSNVKKLNKMFALYGLSGIIRMFGKMSNLESYINELKLQKQVEQDVYKFSVTTAEDADCDYMFMGIFAGDFSQKSKNEDIGSKVPVTIDMSLIDTSNVTRMEGMFMACTARLDLTNFDTRKARSTKMMFFAYGVINLFTTAQGVSVNSDEPVLPYIKFPEAIEPDPPETEAIGEDEAKFVLNADCDTNFMFAFMLSFASEDATMKDFPFERVDLNGIDVSAHKNFDTMFALSTGLVNYDISKWDISSATSFNFMFGAYGLLERLMMFSSFEAASLPKPVSYMTKLPDITTLENSNVSAVGMFAFATFIGAQEDYEKETEFATLDLSTWSFDKIDWMYGMFAGYNFNFTIKDRGLPSIVGAKIVFNNDSATKPVKFCNGADLTSMFAFSNVNIDLSGFDISNVWSMNSMFAFYGTGYTNLEPKEHAWNIIFPPVGTEATQTGFVIPAGCSVRQMFAGFQADTASIKDIVTSNVTDMTRMFALCDVRYLDISKWDTSSVVDMKEMFAGAGAQTLDLSEWKFDKVKDMRFMFAGYGANSEFWWGNEYENIIYFPGSKNDAQMKTGSHCDATAMFMGSNVESLLLYGFNVENIDYVDYMFAFSDKLKSINVAQETDWYQDGHTLRTGYNMFLGCISLVGQCNTKYMDVFTGLQFAHMDQVDNPGYFTSTVALRESFTMQVPGNDSETYQTSLFLKAGSRTTGFTADQLHDVQHVEFIQGDPSSVQDGQDISLAGNRGVVAYIHKGDIAGVEKTILSVVSASTLYVCENSLQAMFSYGYFDPEDPDRPFPPLNSNSAFSLFNDLESVDFGNALDTVTATTTAHMFAFCHNLVSVDMTQISTDNVVDMSHMFMHCGKDSANIILNNKETKKNVNTRLVKDFSWMFYKANVDTLDLTEFELLPDTKVVSEDKVELDLTWMFGYTNNYTGQGVNITFPTYENSFTTKDENIIIHYDRMFAMTKPLNNSMEYKDSLDLSGFKLDSNDTCTYMFNANEGETTEEPRNENLERIYINSSYKSANWNDSGIPSENAKNMFASCYKLHGEGKIANGTLVYNNDLTKWPWIDGPTDLTCAHLDYTNEDPYPNTFTVDQCGYFSNVNASADWARMQARLDADGGIFKQVLDGNNHIHDVQFTRDLYPQNYLYKKDFSEAGNGSVNLYLIDVDSNEKVTPVEAISEIKEKNLSLIVDASATIVNPNMQKGKAFSSAYEMFADLGKNDKHGDGFGPEYINLSNYSFELDWSGGPYNQATYTQSMFEGLSNLISIDFPNLALTGTPSVFNNLYNPYNMFKGCTNLKSIDISNWGNIIDLRDSLYIQMDNPPDVQLNMFTDCKSLISINSRYKTNWSYGDSWKNTVIADNCYSLTSIISNNPISWRDEKFRNPVDKVELFLQLFINRNDGVSYTLSEADIENDQSIIDKAKIAEGSSGSTYLSDYKPYIREVTIGMDYNEVKTDETPEYYLSDSKDPDTAVYGIVEDYGEDLQLGEDRHAYALHITTKNGGLINSGKTSLYAMFRGFNYLKVFSVRSEQFNFSDDAKDVYITWLNTSEAKTVSRMFEGTTPDVINQDSSLNLAFMDTSKVTDFSYMFYNSNFKRTYLDIYYDWEGHCSNKPSKFNFDSATNLSHMFDGAGFMGFDNTTGSILPSWECYSELNLPLADYRYNPDPTSAAGVWKPFTVQANCDCSYMFANSRYGTLDFSNCQFDNVTNFDYMFAYSGIFDLNAISPLLTNQGDDNLQLELVNAYASNNVDQIHAVYNKIIENGKPLGRSAGAPGYIVMPTDYYWGACSGAQASMEGMFEGTLYGEQLYDDGDGINDQWASIDLRKMKTDNVTNMNYMFAYTFFGRDVLLSQYFTTKDCPRMYEMFAYAGSLNATGEYMQSLNDQEMGNTPIRFTFSEESDVRGMFQGASVPVDLTICNTVEEIDPTQSVLDVVPDYTRMFCDYGFNVLSWFVGGRPDLLEINICGKGQTWTPPEGASMQEMFRGCKAHLDISKLNVKNVANFSGTFMSYGNLDSTGLFFPELCTITWPETWISQQQYVDMSAMFKGYKGADNLDDVISTGKFKIDNVVNMSEMFRGCKVDTLDLTKWDDLSLVQNASYMFSSEFLRPSYVHVIKLSDTFFKSLLGADNKGKIVKIVDISYLFGSAIVENDTLCRIESNENLTKLIDDRQVDMEQTMTYCEGMFAGCRELVNDKDPKNVIYYDPDHIDYTYAHPVYTDDQGKVHRGYFYGTWTPQPVIADNQKVPTTDPVLDNPATDAPSVSDPVADNSPESVLPQDAIFTLLINPLMAFIVSLI